MHGAGSVPPAHVCASSSSLLAALEKQTAWMAPRQFRGEVMSPWSKGEAEGKAADWAEGEVVLEGRESGAPT